MKVNQCDEIFNLMDTNGRRDDVINALQGYLHILDDIVNTRHLKWKSLPESTAQFHFYEQALAFSQDVFKRHKNYDDVMENLGKLTELRDAISEGNIRWINEHKEEYDDVFKKIDSGIEDRARHYTNNLVKLGFTDSKRTISAAGDVLLGKTNLVRDELEKMLPINDVNLMYLRQLLKLRIFTKDGSAYYSPFCMAVYALLRKERISKNAFAEIVQSQNPYRPTDDVEAYIDGYREGQYLAEYEEEIPEEVNTSEQLSEEIFKKYFPNGKTQRSVKKYYEFYKVLYQFDREQTVQNLAALLSVWENNSKILNKAFGQGKSIFSTRRGERPKVVDFLKKQESDSEDMRLFSGRMNENLYRRFMLSKRADEVREKADTTRRIFKATGIISFGTGYAELVNKELCECIFDRDTLKRMSVGRMEDDPNPAYDHYEKYEGGVDTFFCGVQSLAKILNYSKEKIENVLTAVKDKFGASTLDEIVQKIQEVRNEEFAAYVERKYPQEDVKELLSLFSDRNNDRKIKEKVNREATVPTIYEYVVGLAWYYFSGKSINLLESYNLTLSADFEPITHAGGGAGDIVIRQSDKVIMLEATLMNANSQKRGEWEPVLRHSVNLKIEEESAGTGRKVTTFFIADSFDCNTINIWKAISSVPLQSSVDKDKFTDNVIIMPINNVELTELMDKEDEYNEIIDKVRALFVDDEKKFDREWRDNFIHEVIGGFT